MMFKELFKVYLTRNPEVRLFCRRLYEFGVNVSQSQSAAATNGLDVHSMKRQKDCLAWAKAQIENIAASPLPDMPATHPTMFEVDLSQPYLEFVEEPNNGVRKPINEDVQFVATNWMRLAVELLQSNSAALSGGLTSHDATRALSNLEAFGKHLSTLADMDALDLPETAFPTAPLNADNS